MRIHDYIEENRITLEITGGPEYNVKMLGETEWPHHLWELVLTNGTDGTEMTLDWTTGIGITADPEAPEVMDNLIGMAWGYWNSRSFEEWASDYGYDLDSLKAYRLYDEVKAQSEEFKAFVGGWAEVERLAMNYERL